ncbi:MAG: protein-L-isoaspartate O-methyltransferase [Zoogloeaceae bacterium]|jgi:protein-L-isoaspartate(D-aspartate) O-methyltransferase|nr:protein-L-isoaspartate O-methyltransferase [Zoogloeaceae bacterium]
MNIEQARENMIAQQFRPCEVLDEATLAAFRHVRREAFVPPACKDLAFADTALPLGQGQTMLEPRLEARLLQELALKPTERVLEVGTGSGFMAALLASQAGAVVSLEIVPELAGLARRNLEAAGITNVRVEIANGAEGWKGEGEGLWDAILISGAVPAVPEKLLKQLRPGGRLAAIVGSAPIFAAVLVVATENGFKTTKLLETGASPLAHFDTPAFRF